MAQGKVAVERVAPTYSLAGDFCRIFAEDMSSLYRVAYLLTGDYEKAESCFRIALSECLHSMGVFKEWARPWARRAVIQAAIGLMKPADERIERSSPVVIGPAAASTDLLQAVADLPVFQRFVYVMTVLERLSDQDSKLLLGSTRQGVVSARLEAMQLLATKQSARAAIRPLEVSDDEECRFGAEPFVIPGEGPVAEVEKRIA